MSLGSGIVAAAAILGVVYMASNGIEGWGWLVAIGILAVLY